MARPYHSERFKPYRVRQGQAISRVEMTRRLAHFLQIPQRYGYRLMLAFENVLFDALMHGEGFKIRGAGTLILERHKTDTVKGFGKVIKRKILYRYHWKNSKSANTFLKRISDLDREGVINDYFSDARD